MFSEIFTYFLENVKTIFKQNPHFTIIIKRIGCKIFTSQKYFPIITQHNFCMQIRFCSQNPVKSWCCKYRTIPFVISCTNNYFLPIVIKFLKQIDNIWICHGLYIYQNLIICLIDKFLNLMARINGRHNDLWRNFGKLGESFVCKINLKNFFQKFSRWFVRTSIDIFTIFCKKWSRPISSANIIVLVNKPKFRMCKNIAIVVSIFYRNMVFTKKFTSLIVDCGRAIDISFEQNLNIHTPIFRIQKRWARMKF